MFSYFYTFPLLFAKLQSISSPPLLTAYFALTWLPTWKALPPSVTSSMTRWPLIFCETFTSSMTRQYHQHWTGTPVFCITRFHIRLNVFLLYLSFVPPIYNPFLLYLCSQPTSHSPDSLPEKLCRPRWPRPWPGNTWFFGMRKFVLVHEQVVSSTLNRQPLFFLHH